MVIGAYGIMTNQTLWRSLRVTIFAQTLTCVRALKNLTHAAAWDHI